MPPSVSPTGPIAANSAALDLNTPLVTALKAHKVQAEVSDLDHYRIHGVLAVETDYIITVIPTGDSTDDSFDAFILSKSFSQFRTFAAQLKKIVDSFTGRGSPEISKDAVKVAKYCELVAQLMDSQPTSYLAKVNYSYVKQLAKQRRLILNEILDATCTYFPSTFGGPEDHPLLKEVAVTVETLFLTDHCDGKAAAETIKPSSSKDGTVSGNTSTGDSSSTITSGSHKRFNIPILGKALNLHGSDKTISSSPKESRSNPAKASSVVIPMTRKERRSDKEQEDAALQNEEQNLAVMDLPDQVPPKPESIAPAAQVPAETTTTTAVGTGLSGAVPPPPLNTLLMSPASPVHPVIPSVQRVTTDARAAIPTPSSAKMAKGSSSASSSTDIPPLVFAVGSVVMLFVVKWAAKARIAMDGDLELLLLFASFCLGFHCPRPETDHTADTMVMPIQTTIVGAGPAAGIPMSVRGPDRCGRLLLRRSMIGSMSASSTMTPRPSHMSTRPSTVAGETIIESGELTLGGDADNLTSPIVMSTRSFDGNNLFYEEMIEEDVLILGSPLPRLPEGVPVGSTEYTNCWSETPPSDFRVRGPKYFADKKKIDSGPYIFESRGMDLFLTDMCPENVGMNHAVFGGNLREKPTFIVNFRLPWGVLVFYSTIPDRFVPFIKACYDPTFDKSKLPDLKQLSPGDRATARFLMEDDEYKNGCLKIVPVVVDGPWVVRQVVGGKPALIGTKLPISYVYQAEEGKKKAMYLEADLDISASSVARHILSVTRSYTDSLTLDLGFVVQANREDELPEQMLMGLRFHRLDPLTAPSLPPMKDMFMEQNDRDNDDDDSSR